MSKFLIGWGEESLVPAKKVRIAGQFYERISEYVETEITATAMAIESNGDSAIIVSADITSATAELIAKSGEKLKKLIPDFPVEKLIVGATHTHTSILYTKGSSMHVRVLSEFMPEDKEYKNLVDADDGILTADEAIEWISDKIAFAAKKAWDSKKPAMYANEFGRAVVGFCRRVEYDDDTAQMWGDTNTANFRALEGGNDSGVELLYMFDENKKLTGVVANIACPSQTLEHRSFLSADYWGYVKENLRKEFGDDIYLLAMGGAGGDQCPRDLVRWVNPETPINDPNIDRPDYFERKAGPSMFDIKGCKQIAKRVSNEIISVYEDIEVIRDEIEFEHKPMVLDLPLRRATKTEYNNAVRELEYYCSKNSEGDSFDFRDSAKMHVYAGTIERFREQQFKEVVPTEVHVIRFGDVAITTNPFELFLDYGNQIKARCRCRQTFVMQLTGPCLGYLPTEKAEKNGHYSAYISSGHVGHEGGDILVRTTIAEVNKMFG